MLALGAVSFLLSFVFDTDMFNSLGAPHYVHALRVVVPVFGAIGAVYFWFIAMVRRDFLAIDDIGIIDQASSKRLGRVNWEEISTINVYKLFGEYNFVIALKKSTATGEQVSIAVKSMKVDHKSKESLEKNYPRVHFWQ